MSYRDELISKCRYYRGEQESPFDDSNKSMFWYYESCWVRFEENAKENRDSSGAETLRLSIEGYNHYGLGDFSKDDGTPVGIKAILLNRYMHWGGMPNEDEIGAFKRWYIREYLDNGNQR